VVAGGAAFVVAWSDRGAEEASLDDALRRFRDGDPAETTVIAGVQRPAAGVYSYSGEGTERLSLLGTTQDWGATLPATVTHVEACWTLRIDFSTHHTQEWTYCPEDGALTEVAGRTSQRFDFVAVTVDDLTVFSCDPPGDVIRVDARRGDSWAQSCTGHSDTLDTTTVSSGTNTFVGVESVEVGGRSVAAYRYRSERAISGGQTGTERSETWFAVRDGLPLRATRSIHVESPSPLGTVTYEEEGTFALGSLSPRR
jgi:hypothetical protein